MQGLLWGWVGSPAHCEIKQSQPPFFLSSTLEGIWLPKFLANLYLALHHYRPYPATPWQVQKHRRQRSLSHSVFPGCLPYSHPLGTVTGYSRCTKSHLENSNLGVRTRSLPQMCICPSACTFIIHLSLITFKNKCAGVFWEDGQLWDYLKKKKRSRGEKCYSR